MTRLQSCLCFWIWGVAFGVYRLDHRDPFWLSMACFACMAVIAYVIEAGQS